MRSNRIKVEHAAYYLVTTRCTNREYLLEDHKEKAILLDLMRRAETFCGVKLLNFVLMDNHIHFMVQVPEREEIDDAELHKRITCLYGEQKADLYMGQIAQNDELEFPLAGTATREKFLERMYDISMYAKTVLERFSQSHNQRHNRVGSLWQGRFHSTLIEEQQDYLLTGCGYIDLNPVRARMVRDPKDYAWSSYGMAVSGDVRAQEGLIELMRQFGVTDWKTCQKQYRIYLYARAQQQGLNEQGKAGGVFTEEEVRKVIAAGGELPIAARLHCRIRHFTRGLAIGSEMWVDKLMQQQSKVFEHRARAGPKECRDPVAPGLFSAKHCRMQN